MKSRRAFAMVVVVHWQYDLSSKLFSDAAMCFNLNPPSGAGFSLAAKYPTR
jgi:hypothetical protein